MGYYPSKETDTDFSIQAAAFVAVTFHFRKNVTFDIADSIIAGCLTSFDIRTDKLCAFRLCEYRTISIADAIL